MTSGEDMDDRLDDRPGVVVVVMWGERNKDDAHIFSFGNWKSRVDITQR